MKLILANPRGFCAGVNMAIESLTKALDIYGAPIYVFHEIVHNRSVVERFKKQGAIFVDDLNKVPPEAVILYSAHGVAPSIREQTKEKRLRAIDATCPLVTKVHFEALKFAKEGYTVLLIGHEGHDEVVGTMGEAPQCIRLVQNVEEAKRLNFSPKEKLAYLTQTTLSVQDAKLIIDFLTKQYPNIRGPARKDICYATTNRQEAIHHLSAEVDLVLVLGSVNSSNSQRLVETATNRKTPAYLIDTVEEIHPQWLEGVRTVLITAGASAPEDLVQQCVAFLCSQYGAQIEERVFREESTRFALPKPLQSPVNLDT